MLPDVEPEGSEELPDYFCWTKYGTEAGENIGSILERKERERSNSDGIFLWGIGNAIGPSLKVLLETTARPQVVFTPMRSRPAARDIAPAQTAVWRKGVGLDGEPFELPATSRVTSRVGPTRDHHFALVCRSDQPIGIATSSTPSFSPSHVENLRSGSQVGASQVTSVVRRIMCSLGRETWAYRVAFKAELVAPYFVRLTERSVLHDADTGCC